MTHPQYDGGVPPMTSDAGDNGSIQMTSDMDGAVHRSTDNMDPKFDSSMNLGQAINRVKGHGKHDILFITKIAKNKNPHDVVDLVVSNSNDKLLMLYIMDSLMKNIGGPYIGAVGERIEKIFVNIFKNADVSTRKKMFTLRHTWNGVLADCRLFKIDKLIHDIDVEWPIHMVASCNDDNIINLTDSFDCVDLEDSVFDSEVHRKVFEMKVKGTLFDKIENNEKTVEGRIATNRYASIGIGDTIGIAKYKNFEDMLNAEGIQKCLPAFTDLSEAVQFYRSFPKYTNLEVAHGVLAFRLSDCVSGSGSHEDVVLPSKEDIDKFDGSHGVIKKVVLKDNHEADLSIERNPVTIASHDDEIFDHEADLSKEMNPASRDDNMIDSSGIKNVKKRGMQVVHKLEEGRYYLVDRRIILSNRPIEIAQIHRIPKDGDEVEVNFLKLFQKSSTKFYLPKPLEPEMIDKEFVKKKLTWVSMGKNGQITIGMLPNDIQKYETKHKIGSLTQTLASDWDPRYDNLDFDSADTLIKKASSTSRKAKPLSKSIASDNLEKPKAAIRKQSKASHRPRSGQWIETGTKYTISNELFDDIYSTVACAFKPAEFLYRKDSIGKEISECFPGCVIYVERYYNAKKHNFWRIQGYCSHLDCRNYRLIASYNNPQVFKVSVDMPEICHKGPLTRQIRRFERDQQHQISLSNLPSSSLVTSINKTPDDIIGAGNYGDIVSADVQQKIRSEALSKQDAAVDDYADLEALQTKDEKTNYISNLLSRQNFGVYLHSKDQIVLFNKLHRKRSQDGVQIVGRVDASGDIARALTSGDKMLYYALTVNIRVLHDKKSTALPISEQFNIRHTSQDISSWLFNLVSSYQMIYDDPPLLFDYLISDFSNANFHAILLAFNRLTLPKYLKRCYEWIQYKIENGKFPDSFDIFTKIKMCYTHIMHTYGDMTKRHFGKTESNAQRPESRIILEILASMIKSTDFRIILQLFEQLSILLCSEYNSDHIENAILTIKEVTSPIEDELDLDQENNLHCLFV